MIMRCLSPSPGTPQGGTSPGESNALIHAWFLGGGGCPRPLSTPARRCPSRFSPQDPGRRMQREAEPASAARAEP